LKAFFNGHAFRCDARIFWDVESCNHKIIIKYKRNADKTLKIDIGGKSMEKNLICKKITKKVENFFVILGMRKK
jgi:hypothetical protein